MITLRLIWAWCKKYWYLFLALAGFVLGFILFRRGNVDIMKIIQGINDDHQRDLEAIKNKEKTIEDARKQINAEEQKKLEELDKKYDEKEKELDKQREERVEEILKETDSDPDALAEELAKITGSQKLD